MDGTKIHTDTTVSDTRVSEEVGRCSLRAEMSLRKDMDLGELRILVVVGSIYSESL